MYRFLTSLTLAVFIISGLSAQVGEMHYKVYSATEQKEVTLDDIIAGMVHHDVLFFGEEHNDSVGHYLEHLIFSMMHARYGAQVALSLEMFDRDVQTVMDEYLDHEIREKSFIKDARVWSNYRDYRPMVEYAKENDLDVVCANAPSRYTNLVGRKGMNALKGLPSGAKAFMAPVPYRLAEGGYYDKLVGFMSGGHSPEPDSSGQVAPPVLNMGGFDLITAQSLWDATMAWSIAQYLKKHKGSKVFQVNGRFHSDERFAIVTQLKNYRKKASALVISCGPADDFNDPDWSQYRHFGDYIILTDPAVPRTYESGF